MSSECADSEHTVQYISVHCTVNAVQYRVQSTPDGQLAHFVKVVVRQIDGTLGGEHAAAHEDAAEHHVAELRVTDDRVAEHADAASTRVCDEYKYQLVMNMLILYFTCTAHKFMRSYDI